MGSGDAGDTVTVAVTARNSSGSTNANASGTGTVTTGNYRIFYINYSSGNDHNSGTSETSPWKLAPGMVGFAGSYSAQTGDHFIFAGGVTWPNSAFPFAVVAGGTSGNDDYYGVNSTWYAGSSFSQPVFNASSQNITGSDPNGSGGRQDILIDLRNHDYVEVDDISLSNFEASGVTGSYGTCAAIMLYGDQHITVNRVTIANFYVDDTAYNASDCAAIYDSSAPVGDTTVENSTITGANDSYGEGIYDVGNIENNTVSGLPFEVYAWGHGVVSGNNIGACGTPFPAGSSGLHADAVQENGSDGGTFYYHDNVIHDTGYETSPGTNECEAMLIGNPNGTDYAWNNVLYNIGGDAMSLNQSGSGGCCSGAGHAAYIWDNSIAGGNLGNSSPTGYCLRSGHPGNWATIDFWNNLCVSSASKATDPSLSATTLAVTTGDVLLTPTQTANYGYASTASTYPYQPPAGSPPTKGGGSNLTSACSASLSSLCTTTSYAGHINVNPRPTSGSWDAGAY